MSYLSWPTTTVLEKLQELKLEKYTDSFRSNDISGAVLPLLTEKHLKELGMTTVGHRLKFVKFIRLLERGMDPLSKPSSTSTKKSTTTTNNYSSSPSRPTTSGGTTSTTSSYNGASVQKKAQPAPVQKKKQSAPPPPSYDDNDYDEEADYNPPPRKASNQKKSTQFNPNNNQLNTSLRRNAPPAKAAKPASRAPPPPPPDGDDDRVECAYCHRRFASDRIAQHESICARMSTKKKKVFDSSKQRLQGTEAAAYARKAAAYQPERPKPSKYKAEHEKLVEALRAARKFQAYEKAKEEGRAVGPPPELPKYEMEDDDRVQCPICGRKFGAEQAQRHIAVCERMNGGGGGGGRMRTSTNRRGGRR